MTKETIVPFYDRTEAERIAITMTAITERRTALERWAVLSNPEAVHWSARAAIAAEWLANESAVVDLGCGTMNLERHLRADQTYIPIDVVARDGRTIVCDFNCEPPPPTSASAAVCLGLLEYLHEPHDFLSALRDQYRTVVVSYCVADAPEAPQSRREHAWVNDFDTADMDALFHTTGWINIESRGIDRIQRLWRLGTMELMTPTHP